MAISKVRGRYYFFDSHKRDINGLPDYQNGKAVMINFENVSMMTNHVRNIFNGRNLEFTMTPIQVKEIDNNDVIEVGNNNSCLTDCTMQSSSVKNRICLSQVRKNKQKNKRSKSGSKCK